MAAAQVPDPRRPSPQGPGGARQGGWTAGRIVAVVVGAILVLCSVGLLGGSGVALWAQTSRHGGYADLATATYSVPGYAIASDTVSLHLGNGAASGLIGTVRIRVTQASGTTPAFIGIAPADAAARYLAGVQVNVAATLPALPWIATGLLIGGIIFLVGGILLIVIPVRRAS